MLQAKPPDQFFHAELVVGGDGLEHAAREGSDFQRLVVGHGDVVGAVELGSQADMRALPPHLFVAQDAQRRARSDP